MSGNEELMLLGGASEEFHRIDKIVGPPTAIDDSCLDFLAGACCVRKYETLYLISDPEKYTTN